MNQSNQGELPDVDVDGESEPSSNYYANEKTSFQNRESDKNIQDYVVPNDSEKAKFLFRHNCRGISKNVKSKNIDSGKKLAEIDKETDKFLQDRENLQKKQGIKNQELPLSKYRQTNQECKEKMMLIQKRENPQEDKKQWCYEFYSFLEELVKFFDIQNYEAVIKDLQPKETKAFKLVKYYKYKIGDQEKWNNFIKCLQSHPQYAEYRQYLGVNIKQARRNFESWIKNQLREKNQFDVLDINHIAKKLVEDPFDPFWNEKELSDIQKQSLYQIIYVSPKLLEYKLKLLIPESLLSKNFEVIEKVLQYLVEKQYIKSGQIQQCVKSLQNNDDMLFYEIASISNYRKKISQYFDEIGQKYFFEQREIRGNDCPKKLQALTILKIRTLLHSLNVNFDLYQEIEEKLLNLKIDDLWNVMISPKNRQKIIKEFETDNLFLQYRKYKRNIEVPLEIKVKNQLLKTFTFLDFKNLSYKQMEQFASQIVKKKISMKSSLSQNQIKDFEQNIQKCENVKRYFYDGRRNISQDSSNLRQKLLFIFNDCPELLRYDSITSIINYVLDTSKVLEIYDFLDISPNQKKYIVDFLIGTNQYSNFKASFEKIQAIKCEKEFQQQIIKKFTDKGKILINYYQLYGRFQQKLFGQAAQSLPGLKNFQDRIQQLLNLEESQRYKRFKKNFEIIFHNNKKKIQEQFSIDVRCLLQIRIGNADQLIQSLQNTNYNIQQSIPVDYHDSIKADVGYKDLMKWKNAQRANGPFFEKINTQMTIDGIFFHPSVIKYSPDQRRELINGLLAYGTDFLTKSDLIRKSQKEQIRRLLGQVIISPQKQLEDVQQPQIKDEPATTSPQQICNEIKKLFVGTEFIEKMTVQEIRTFFKEYPFSQDKVNKICSDYNLVMKKKSGFKDNLAKIKNDLSMRVEQLQKVMSKNPSPPQSPTKAQKKQIKITIPETPKDTQNKFFRKQQQPQPVINLEPIQKKSKEEASKEILEILLQSNSKSEKLNIQTVQSFFKGEFNPEQSANAFGIQALRKKNFNDLVKNNLEKIKQLSKSLE